MGSKSTQISDRRSIQNTIRCTCGEYFMHEHCYCLDEISMFIFFSYRIMTHPNRNFAESSRFTDPLRKSLSFRISTHRNHEDMHLLSTNMNVICTVSISCVALLNDNQTFITSPHQRKKTSEQIVCSKQMRLSPFIHSSLIDTFCVKSRK